MSSRSEQPSGARSESTWSEGCAQQAHDAPVERGDAPHLSPIGAVVVRIAYAELRGPIRDFVPCLVERVACELIAAGRGRPPLRQTQVRAAGGAQPAL